MVASLSPLSPRGSDSRPTPASLLHRIRNLEDDLAWDQFAHLYRGFVERIARQNGVDSHDAEDVAQNVLLRLTTSIHDFEHRQHLGAFRSWLRRLVHWCTHDHRRQQARFPDPLDPEPGTDSEDFDPRLRIASQTPDPASELEDATRLKLVRMALHRLQRKFSPATLQIFELYVVDGWDLTKLTRFLDIPRSRVYLAKHRVAPYLRREIALLLAQVPERLREPPPHARFRFHSARNNRR